MNRAVAFRPGLTAQDHLDHTDIALRLGVNGRGKIEELLHESTPVCAKLSIPLGVKVLFQPSAAGIPRFFEVLRI
jgi:hypothetical protein